ncbi:hypothetical protein B0H14DRAFT_464256 [Mycena olivaceomarginata]|nr:hypothetical protein B0H14DRAFT_464256 [Mycena olivaceomarginata]
MKPFLLLLGHQARRSQPLRLPRSTPSRSAAVCAPSYIHLAPAALGRSQDCQPHPPTQETRPLIIMLGRTLLAALQSQVSCDSAQVAIRAIPVCDYRFVSSCFVAPKAVMEARQLLLARRPVDVILLTGCLRSLMRVRPWTDSSPATVQLLHHAASSNLFSIGGRLAHSSPCGSRGWPVSHGQTHPYTVLLASWFQQLQRSNSRFISDLYHVSTMP